MARSFVMRPVPRSRQVVLDYLAFAGRRFPVHGLVECDVAQARSLIDAADPPVSWTGFVIASMGRAVARHPEVNARRVGNRLMCFERVEVGCTVERHVDGAVVLDVTSILDADRKTCAQITAELRDAKQAGDPMPARGGWMTRLARAPAPVRHGAMRLAARMPRIAAEGAPPVGVTSLGMFSHGSGWAIPLSPLVLLATVGPVVERPVVRDGQVVIRPMLPLTLTFDHAVIDGAPGARFVETLRQVVESADALSSTP